MAAESPLHLFCTLAACAALLCPCAAFPQAVLIDSQDVGAEALGLSTGAALGLQLTLVRLEGSGWTRERSLAALREAGAILVQCGVALERVRFESVAAPNHLDFSTPAARELARAHPVGKPAVYLVRDTKSRPAFDAEAIGRGNSRTRPEIADTVWMTAATRNSGVALAHELAHVLMDSGEHSEEEGNLMREETSPRSTALTAAQCARLRGAGSRNGLLRNQALLKPPARTPRRRMRRSSGTRFRHSPAARRIAAASSVG